MTETFYDSHAAWIKRFADELRVRRVEQQQIDTAVDSILEHLTDSSESPSDAFGDPREYAASLELTTRDEGYERAGTYAATVLAIVSFIAFGTAVTRWLAGETTHAVIGWTLAGAIVLLAASICTSVGIARHVVEAAIRERFSGQHAGLWGRWAPVAIAIPWVFPVFAAIIVFVAAIRS